MYHIYYMCEGVLSSQQSYMVDSLLSQFYT